MKLYQRPIEMAPITATTSCQYRGPFRLNTTAVRLRKDDAACLRFANLYTAKAQRAHATNNFIPMAPQVLNTVRPSRKALARVLGEPPRWLSDVNAARLRLHRKLLSRLRVGTTNATGANYDAPRSPPCRATPAAKRVRPTVCEPRHLAVVTPASGKLRIQRHRPDKPLGKNPEQTRTIRKRFPSPALPTRRGGPRTTKRSSRIAIACTRPDPSTSRCA